MHHNAVAPSAACRNCGAGLIGEYCHACGEARPHHHEFQWKHMVHDGIHEFIHLDGKIFRTLWLLISRAGLLTQEYLAGRRTPYIRPLRLYIFIATLHLLAMSHSFYRVELFKARDYGGVLTRMVEATANRTHSTPAAVEESMNLHLAKAYSVAQYFAVLGFALFPWMLYRKRSPHYVQHLIYSLHVYCFFFLLTGFVSLFLSIETWVRSPLPLVTLTYIVFSLRRLYDERWWSAFWKGVLLRLGLFAAEFMVLSIAIAYAIFQVRRSH